MSAFTVNNDHIDLMVTAAVRLSGYNEKYVDIPKAADGLGRDLLAENFASVNFRYREETPVPEYSWTPVAEVQAEGDLPVPVLLQILRAAHCYDYQSCEHPAWEASKAHRASRYIQEWVEDQLTARRWPKDAGMRSEPPTWRGLHRDGIVWEWDRSRGFQVEEKA